MTYERELELTADRVRQLPASRLEPCAGAVYGLLEAMTDRPVPRLRSLAWGDQLVVIGREVPGDRRGALVEPLRALRRGFDLSL